MWDRQADVCRANLLLHGHCFTYTILLVFLLTRLLDFQVHNTTPPSLIECKHRNKNIYATYYRKTNLKLVFELDNTLLTSFYFATLFKLCRARWHCIEQSTQVKNGEAVPDFLCTALSILRHQCVPQLPFAIPFSHLSNTPFSSWNSNASIRYRQVSPLSNSCLTSFRLFGAAMRCVTALDDGGLFCMRTWGSFCGLVHVPWLHTAVACKTGSEHSLRLLLPHTCYFTLLKQFVFITTCFWIIRGYRSIHAMKSQ